MRKESIILVFGTIFSIMALIGLKTGHFYVHGLCNCLSGKLFEYIIPVSGLVTVILLTNSIIIKLISQREVESENVKKAYETMDGITRISDAMLSRFQLNRLGRTENYLKIIGVILGTEGVILRNKATACFLALLNRQKNTLEGNIIYSTNADLVVDSEKIPLSARIMALADVYDALTSKRVYKEAFSQEVAESTISAGIGSHFDPDISTVFMEHNKKDLL